MQDSTVETETTTTVSTSARITGITLLTGDGADRLMIKFDMPSPVYPFVGAAHASMEVAARRGLGFIVARFRGVPTTIIYVGRATKTRTPTPEERLVDWATSTYCDPIHGDRRPLPEPWNPPPRAEDIDA